MYLLNFQILFKIYRFPTPSAPPMNLFGKLIGDSISVAIWTFGLQVSFGKLFAKKYKYKISPNQEFFAYGISNIVSSFFTGNPGSMAISRTYLADGIGVKTQLVAVINTAVVLLVIFVLGPYLETLPNVITSIF